ncbi:hypothetical protein LPH50_04825 [Xylella taiwanensis]|uniref:Uncharacterized protein n=1 Tax=Xylella taiwanensis TaxID=1444770 RepID=Z9JHA6_9GAMM|nr:hypothetical protein [Xylella taiwanensis]EWS77127.1 hypothetical protein AF72_12470 [Xylella taiwanensis]MCD8455305.1 hypothetical protein [Xylella taiwanensis]MCD8459848.1 hypothetical protein [Xylella taiwanensis]MCD8464092.1 hypothetical protein [Xylella taiwanensis]MCD8464352.1 hypothetical protein [Xylella taiwanensis]
MLALLQNLDVAAARNVSNVQAKVWLQPLAAAGVLGNPKQPVRDIVKQQR